MLEIILLARTPELYREKRMQEILLFTHVSVALSRWSSPASPEGKMPNNPVVFYLIIIFSCWSRACGILGAKKKTVAYKMQNKTTVGLRNRGI